MSNPKFTIAQHILSKALQTCGRALGDNKIVPITEYFKFSIVGANLTIDACDLSIIISKTIPVESDNDLAICLPGIKLRDYIKNCNNGIITFELVKHIVAEKRETLEASGTERITPEQITYSVLIISGESKLSIPAESDDGFPEIPTTDEKSFSIQSEDFLELLFKTTFAISDDQLRPAFTGLNVFIKNGKITCMSSDTYRMPVYSLPIDSDIEAEFIIGKPELLKIQSLSPIGPMQFGICDKVISLSFNETIIAARLIDQRNIDYQFVIPSENHIEFLTSTSALKTAINRIKPFANKVTKTIKLEISLASLLLVAEDVDYSEEAKETILGVSNEAITIGVNSEFLLSVLNSFVDNKVWLSFSSPRSQIVITEGQKYVNGSNDNLCILMPCRL